MTNTIRDDISNQMPEKKIKYYFTILCCGIFAIAVSYASFLTTKIGVRLLFEPPLDTMLSIFIQLFIVGGTLLKHYKSSSNRIVKPVLIGFLILSFIASASGFGIYLVYTFNKNLYFENSINTLNTNLSKLIHDIETSEAINEGELIYRINDLKEKLSLEQSGILKRDKDGIPQKDKNGYLIYILPPGKGNSYAEYNSRYKIYRETLSQVSKNRVDANKVLKSLKPISEKINFIRIYGFEKYYQSTKHPQWRKAVILDYITGDYFNDRFNVDRDVMNNFYKTVKGIVIFELPSVIKREIEQKEHFAYFLLKEEEIPSKIVFINEIFNKRFGNAQSATKNTILVLLLLLPGFILDLLSYTLINMVKQIYEVDILDMPATIEKVLIKKIVACVYQFVCSQLRNNSKVFSNLFKYLENQEEIDTTFLKERELVYAAMQDLTCYYFSLYSPPDSILPIDVQERKTIFKKQASGSGLNIDSSKAMSVIELFFQQMTITLKNAEIVEIIKKSNTAYYRIKNPFVLNWKDSFKITEDVKCNTNLIVVDKVKSAHVAVPIITSIRQLLGERFPVKQNPLHPNLNFSSNS